MRQQTAVADHLHEVGGDRLAGERLPGGQVPDLSGFRVHRQRIAGADPPCLRADESRQAEVEGVAVEKPGEGFGEERRDAEMPERRGRLLARGAGAEISSRHDDVSGPHRRGERRIDRFEAVLCDLLERELHVAARSEHVRIDVVAEYPGPHASISRGSHTRPATADAAPLYAEARSTRPAAAPSPPPKYRPAAHPAP